MTTSSMGRTVRMGAFAILIALVALTVLGAIMWNMLHD